MRERKYYQKHRWRLEHGYGETELTDVLFDEYKDTEWSPEFEKLMRNRLVVGGLRYGKMGHEEIPHGKPRYDRVKTMKRRLDLFSETGNAEYLVDIANFSLLLYEERDHENWHFDPRDDDGEHDTIKK